MRVSVTRLLAWALARPATAAAESEEYDDDDGHLLPKQVVRAKAKQVLNGGVLNQRFQVGLR